MGKIYLVVSNSGEYEDYHSWNEKAFIKREDAEKYADELKSQRSTKPQFVTDEFEIAYENVENNLPMWEKEDDTIPFEDWYEEQSKKEMKLTCEELYKMGFMVTEQMLHDYEEWVNNIGDYDNSIEEIELI